MGRLSLWLAGIMGQRTAKTARHHGFSTNTFNHSVEAPNFQRYRSGNMGRAGRLFGGYEAFVHFDANFWQVAFLSEKAYLANRSL